MDTSFLRRLSGSSPRPSLLPQHEPLPSSSTYSLHPLPPQQQKPPTYPPHQPNMPSPTPAPAHLPPDLLAPFHRHETHLQAHLQLLLDAQSANLLAGLARPPSPSASSSSSFTTTTTSRMPTHSMRASSRRGPAVTPVRQPVSQPLGLRGARRGIARTMRELRAVKAEESGWLREEVERREEVVGVVRAFEDRKRGLEAEIAQVERGEEEEGEGGTVGLEKRLKAEKETVDVEVRGLEDRLAELRARARCLDGEIDRAQNERLSRVSSWREALRGVDAGVARFLREVPASSTGVGALPVGRRSLEMCREEWEGEREGLVSRQEGVRREVEALDQGVEVWEEVVKVVGGVEAGLRDQIGRQTGGEEGMRGVLEEMDQAIKVLEGKVRMAQMRGWNLLVCAVGAELEAFREGREVLRGALDAAGAGGNEDLIAGSGGKDLEEPGDDGAGKTNGRAGVEEEFGSLSIGGVPVRENRVRPTSLLDRSEDEDDGPGPEFLTSHQEEDE